VSPEDEQARLVTDRYEVGAQLLLVNRRRWCVEERGPQLDCFEERPQSERAIVLVIRPAETKQRGVLKSTVGERPKCLRLRHSLRIRTPLRGQQILEQREAVEGVSEAIASSTFLKSAWLLILLFISFLRAMGVLPKLAGVLETHCRSVISSVRS